MATRREFIGGCSAGALLLAGCRWPGNRLRARVGLLTDTHLGPSRRSCERLERAFRLFRDLRVDAIFHLGDLVNVWNAQAFRNYADIRRETYPDAGRCPKEAFSFGFHDVLCFPGGEVPWEAVWTDVRARLGSRQDLYDRFELAGFTFLVAPEWPDRERYVKLVEGACADNPGKPVFLLQHRPPFGTSVGSEGFNAYDVWERDRGDLPTRAFLDRFPQLVVLSGHVHANLRDERCFWQGTFTSVNCGCLAAYGNGCVADTTPARQNANVLVMELYDDHAEFVRYELEDGRPIDGVWRVAWPYAPEDAARMRREILVRTGGEVRFRAGLSASVGGAGVAVRFPEGVGSSAVHRYRVRVLDARGRVRSLRDVPGPWDRPARAEGLEAVFSPVLFASGETVRLDLRAETSDGRTVGRLSSPWTVPELPRTDVVFEGTPVAAAVATHPWGWVFSPPEGVWRGPAGTRFAVSFDCASDRPARVCLRRGATGAALKGGFAVEASEAPLRYALELTKDSADGVYSLWATETTARDLRISNLRIEKLCR